MRITWKIGVAALLLLIIMVPAVLAATSCAEGCSCMAPEDTKNKGYPYCQGKETPCGTDNLGRVLYCFNMGLPTPSVTSVVPLQTPVATSCGQGCECLSESDAKVKFIGAYERCSNAACGSDQTSTTNSPRYCFRAVLPSTTSGGTVPAVSQTCPDSCGCMSDEDGKKMGYSYCNGIPKVCGYQSWTGSTISTSGQRPLYCYGKGALPACGAGCECMGEAAAVQKFGTYQFCSNAICGYEQSAATGTVSTTSNMPVATAVIPKYCLKKAEVPLQVTGCSYNVEKNTCTGTCTGNTGCVVVGTEKNAATGEEAPICKCQPGSCYFDYSLDLCAGSCPLTGQICQVNTMSKDPLTGKTLFAECHCKAGESGSVVTPRAIVPDIPEAATTTVATTTYTQPCGSYNCTIDSTGRKVCIDCRCIGCEFDAATSTCSGECSEGTSCDCNEWKTDSAGKNICSSAAGCSCRAMCRPDAAGGCSGECRYGGTCSITSYITGKDGAPSPVCGCGAAGTTTPAAKSAGQGGDVIRSIGDFFKNLFGWK